MNPLMRRSIFLWMHLNVHPSTIVKITRFRDVRQGSSVYLSQLFPRSLQPQQRLFNNAFVTS